MTASEALEFLARRVEEQATQENVPLDVAEKQMLRWREAEPGAFCDTKASEQFDSEYNSDEYEAKVSGLIKRAYERDCKDVVSAAKWNEAKSALTGHDGCRSRAG